VQLTTAYTATPSLLGSFTSADRTNGILKSSALATRITALKSARTMPTVPVYNTLQGGTGTNNADSTLSTYITAENTFKDNIKAEYCYYEQRYRYAIGKLIDNITTTSLTRGGATTTAFDNYRTIAINLNTKLNDIVQIVNAITADRYSSSRSNNNLINSLNTDIANRSTLLTGQANILKSDSSAAEVRKRMVEYTKEKNASTSNLLTLYAALNIVAIGVLVILARN
jgi:hypothetical protein